MRQTGKEICSVTGALMIVESLRSSTRQETPNPECGGHSCPGRKQQPKINDYKNMFKRCKIIPLELKMIALKLF